MADQRFELEIAGKYRICNKIGNGSFGEIYRGVSTSGQDVAIKLEPKANRQAQLEREASVYRILGGTIGVPSIYHYSSESEYNALVMDLLGPSLEDLFNFCGRKFSSKTVAMLGIQMLHRLEQLHAKNYISRDIKPDNFLMGIGQQSNIVFLIDYGLAKAFRFNNGKTVPYGENKKLSGTVRYASINMHIGTIPTRRDDLEGLGYVLLYFLTGNLPWQGMKGANRDFKYMRIAQSKIETSVQDLCHGFKEFEIFFYYCRSLTWDQKPDYKFLRTLFSNMLTRLGYTYDFQWDWKNISISIPRAPVPSSKPTSPYWKKTDNPQERVQNNTKMDSSKKKPVPKNAWNTDAKPWSSPKSSSERDTWGAEIPNSKQNSGWDSSFNETSATEWGSSWNKDIPEVSSKKSEGWEATDGGGWTGNTNGWGSGWTPNTDSWGAPVDGWGTVDSTWGATTSSGWGEPVGSPTKQKAVTKQKTRVTITTGQWPPPDKRVWSAPER